MVRHGLQTRDLKTSGRFNYARHLRLLALHPARAHQGPHAQEPRRVCANDRTPNLISELYYEKRAAVVEDYRKCAVHAKQSGFDGVEIHAGGGFLVDLFLQSATNTRSDEYGGSFDNRFRFLLEILEAVKTVYLLERIAVRLSPNSVILSAFDAETAFKGKIMANNSYTRDVAEGDPQRPR